MSVIDDYLDSLNGVEKAVLGHMYGVVRQTVPDATEELSYGMPTFKYKRMGLIAIIANKKFLSVYPFSGRVIENLKSELGGFELTKGSIHFMPDNPISDDLLRKIITARLKLMNK
jgi:uncharacterized protein YdhG (YjbR/CyaY superfamily)